MRSHMHWKEWVGPVVGNDT